MASPISISIDLAALASAGVIQVVAPPPALVTRENAAHLGLTPRQLADTLRAMRRDPRWSGEVVAVGKIRGAPPAAVIAFLRATTSTSSDASPPANDTGARPGDSTLAELDRELADSAPRRRRGGEKR